MLTAKTFPTNDPAGTIDENDAKSAQARLNLSVVLPRATCSLWLASNRRRMSSISASA